MVIFLTVKISFLINLLVLVYLKKHIVVGPDKNTPLISDITGTSNVERKVC